MKQLNQPRRDNLDNKVFGKNVVLECLDSGISITKIWMVGSQQPKIIEIEKKARAKKIPVIKVNKFELDKMTAGADHRSIMAEISPVKILQEDFLYTDKIKKILVAVNIEDPHNFGAIMRSSLAFGIDAIVFPDRNSAPINQTTITTSAGAIFKVNLVRVGNVTNALERLKKNGFWVYGSSVSQDKSENLNKIEFDEKSVILIGNEGKGLSDKMLKHCDFTVHIPVKFESLNVSVATGIILSRLCKDGI